MLMVKGKIMLAGRTFDYWHIYGRCRRWMVKEGRPVELRTWLYSTRYRKILCPYCIRGKMRELFFKIMGISNKSENRIEKLKQNSPDKAREQRRTQFYISVWNNNRTFLDALYHYHYLKPNEFLVENKFLNLSMRYDYLCLYAGLLFRLQIVEPEKRFIWSKEGFDIETGERKPIECLEVEVFKIRGFEDYKNQIYKIRDVRKSEVRDFNTPATMIELHDNLGTTMMSVITSQYEFWDLRFFCVLVCDGEISFREPIRIALKDLSSFPEELKKLREVDIHECRDDRINRIISIYEKLFPNKRELFSEVREEIRKYAILGRGLK